MAGIFSKVSAFARSPQGQKVIKQAQAAAKDPAKRAKAQELGNRLKERVAARKDGKPSTPPSAGTDTPPSSKPS
jgi:hypothetical protein